MGATGKQNKGEDALRRLRTLAGLARRVGERLPGGRYAFSQLDAAERAVLSELRRRLDALSPDTPAAHGAATAPPTLDALMQRSLDQRPDEAERLLCDQLLAQLVPDEARILAALSDGGTIAICHLDAVSRLGASHCRVLANASRVGAEAGVMLADRVPHYLNHLQELGLVQTGPEDRGLAAKYELIESESAVRAAAAAVATELRLRPRITRATAALSPLGQRLWERCAPA